MKRGFYTLLFVGVATASFASTRVVDGVGGGGNFDSLSAALADLAASADNGDATADVINITASYTEAAHVSVDFATLLDEVVINGNGNEIVFQPTAVTDGVVINVFNNDGSSLEINDLTLLPEYNTDGGVQAFPGAAMRIQDQGVAMTGSSVEISNLTINGTTVGNAAVDPDAAAPDDVTRFVEGATPIFAGGIRIDATTGGSDNAINITDSLIAHTASRGLYAAFQDGTTLTTTRVTAKYNTNVGLRTFALTGNWTLNDCVATNNGDTGFATASTTGGSVNAIYEINGGNFSNNGFYGVQLDSAGTYTFSGTPEDPILIIGNPNRGFRSDNEANVITGLSHMIIANNDAFGIDINEIDTAASWADGITGLRMSGNGPILDGVTPAQISFGDTHDAGTDGGPGFIAITNSTFHNPGGDHGATFSVANIEHRFGNDQTINFDGCIFSGNPADEDYAFRFRVPGAGDGNARNIVFNVTESAVVTAGPYAIPSATTFPPAGVVTSGDGTVNEALVIGDDPDYLSLDPTDVEDYLAVQNADYETAGIAGDPLAGGGRYAGPATSVDGWLLLH